MTDHDDIEPSHASSPTNLVLGELQLFGYRPFDDQPDPRPLPEGKMIAGAIADIFDALVATLNDTRLEPDLEDLLWSTVNLFHRAADRISRQLDDNEQAQRKSQREQNASEVRSVELERLTAEGIVVGQAAEILNNTICRYHMVMHARRSDPRCGLSLHNCGSYPVRSGASHGTWRTTAADHSKGGRAIRV